MTEIQDIMYLDSDKGISSDYEEDKKGRYLMPLLDLANMTKDEISESSDVYKAKKADFYRLSGGDIVYASSGNIYINKDENDSIFLGEGNIGVINYVTANETVNHKTYLHERANLYKNYFKGFMFNPNSSSFNFYKDFNSVYKKKYDLFMDICLKNNGMIDEVFPGKEKIRFYNKKTSITKSTTEKVDSYLPGNFQVYSLSQVTPFMFRELQSLPIVNRVVITLENTQGPTEKSRLNILESPKRSYNNSMSLFIPNRHQIEKDLLNVKQLIYNGIKMSGVEDEITVSMDILIDKSADTYDLTLFEEYLSENGIYVMGRRSSLSKPIAIKGYDFVSLIL
jgi:hypothetical protein